MPDLIEQSVLRLNDLLPLKARQDALPPALQAVHRSVIRALVTQGRPPDRADVASRVGADQVDAALSRLADDDLVVLSADRSEIRGAYPVTADETAHELQLNGHRIHAMCALDALSVGSLFDAAVTTRSRCRQTGVAVLVEQHGENIVSVSPTTVRVGVRWQAPRGSAASSLCMEMVFLSDDDAARAWHGGNMRDHNVYTLEQAVKFGACYFRPLL